MTYTLTTTVPTPFDETVASVREALAAQGFGILTEIDMAATLRTKLGVEMPPYLVLGACNPPLAHRALQADPSVGTLLPCNVVVRADGGTTVVEAVDPHAMMSVADDDELRTVAEDAEQRLRAALDSIHTPR
ncbi:Uncharacterized conserved protein, DUF302 family [Paraoerskovia marina]|uniref:Uncharacterized conserved protein, DUF302 family n=1 Tax=Paraoerskovia marina TaxID=545619 RepID=A0A1H1NAL3_9CELL|nr:DUF302 domain-containing protein [Paraoerskovia marina]SDR95349.1 Uncharacterized conserved protein, DUF302 family [Paraoerskovia marina]